MKIHLGLLKNKNRNHHSSIFALLLSALWSPSLHAMDIDWSGQFWSEFNFVHSYTMDSTDKSNVTDPPRLGAGGYYIPGGGTADANFESLFLRLKPKLVVNDNIYIKSEWWVGDPIYGMFGSGLPYPTDQRQFYTNFSRGSFISAQRFWGELVTDIGTFQVGRLPLNWGLGVVWDSGDNVFDRYMSTGDAFRWIAKFGAFSFVPSVIINSTGNTIAGSCNVTGGVCAPGVGSGGVNDFSLAVKYENLDDDLELGLNMIKRIGGAAQDPNSGVLTPKGSAPQSSGSMNFNTYDFFARKKMGSFTLSAEVPIVSGNLAGGNNNYQSFGVATDVAWKASESFEMRLKAGHAPGQPGLSGSTIDSFKAFYFNPNYHVGMILFNYQLANFAGPQTMNNSSMDPAQLKSPYDNSIVNATYGSLGAKIKPGEKWLIRPNFLYAVAPQKVGGTPFFYNTRDKAVYSTVTGANQSADLGFEFDLGFTYQWDDFCQFSWDNGVFAPGSYFAFSNTATANPTSPVIATSVRVGINF